MTDDHSDPYVILGLSPHASAAQINHAYVPCSASTTLTPAALTLPGRRPQMHSCNTS
jgi:hypothetical protein